MWLFSIKRKQVFCNRLCGVAFLELGNRPKPWQAWPWFPPYFNSKRIVYTMKEKSLFNYLGGIASPVRFRCLFALFVREQNKTKPEDLALLCSRRSGNK